ncbi:defensin-6-like [Trachypithecus francoisi]|uniref:defensin-6-like n=1 Tax=Trachypithecus francoisi TaxID=54180 RepID=UPI00141B264F|nr:defensin-6-like [Trachypithecus francoisi]
MGIEPSPSFLTAVLLVALQAQAEPLQAKDEPLQASTYEADAQEQRGAENQDFTVSFAGNASSSLRALSKRHQHCRARSVERKTKHV